MSRKHLPSDCIAPEILEIVEILASRVAERGCDWPNLTRFIRGKVVEKCLNETNGNRAHAARKLNVRIRTFRYYMHFGSFGRITMRQLNG